LCCGRYIFVIAGFNYSYMLVSRVKNGEINFDKIDWILWLKKRFMRLYPTYWLAILLSLLLYYFLGKIEVKSLFDLLLIVLGWPGYQRFKMINPGFWFFSVILQAYLVIPLIFYLCKSEIQLILWLGILGGLATKIICLISFGNPDIFSFFLQNNFLGSYFFPLCLGLYWGFVYFDYQGFRSKDWMISIVTFIVGIFLYGCMALLKVDSLYMLGFDMLLTPFLMLLCYWLCKHCIDKVPKLKEGISLLGINSYQIFLIHQPILFLVLPIIVTNIFINLSIKPLFYLILFAFILFIYIFLFLKLDSWLRTIFNKTLA
ncbi:MAG: acyltransferase family protein, partial [Microcystaceae cyanobacterium]